MCTRETPAPILTEIADRLYLRLEFMLYAVAIETDDHNEPGSVYWEGLRLLLDESVDDIQCLRQAPFPIQECRAAGYSLRAIADELNRQGHRTRCGSSW